ncbi:threonine ammonia-lyase IlvA [Camelimonas sp. ID_303_24]
MTLSEANFRQGVAEAAAELRALFPPTPLQFNAHLSRRYGARIFLKREDLTPVRSYKLRGAFNFMRKRRAAGGADISFCAASAGNHAQGFAFACRHFGARGRIFMPVTTPQQKINKTRMFGGDAIEIELVGDFFDDCYKAAQQYAGQTGAIMAPPFDDPDIIEGQATLALEADRQAAGMPVDFMLLPVGGAGLAAGVASYWRGKADAPELRFVEPAGAASLKASLTAGERVRLSHIDGFVDGAAVAQIGALPFAMLRDFSADAVLTPPEGRICQTMLEMLNVEGIVLEPAGALTTAALQDMRDEIYGKTIVLVVSGGNFDFERLQDVKERALRFEGRKKYLILRLPQRPGALRDFLGLLGPEDDITRFEYLKKSAREFGSILIGIETTQAGNFESLYRQLELAGMHYQDITDAPIIADLLI